MPEQNGLAVRDPAAAIEKVLIQGNLAGISATDRVVYYRQLCESLGLNELTKPFEYLTFQGKEILYAKRDATDQLRKLHNVSIIIVSRERSDDILAVTARATLPNGRTDESVGAVSVGGLKGDAMANAVMKAETKAKRRVTLSIVGLGFLDESEIETIPGATRVSVEQAHADPEPAPLTSRAQAVLDRIDRAVPVGGHQPEAPAASPQRQRVPDRAEVWRRYENLVVKAEGLGLEVPEDVGEDSPVHDILQAGKVLHGRVTEAEAAIDADS